MFWAGIIDFARKKKSKKKKKTYIRVFKKAAIEKPNARVYSHVSKRNPKMVYSLILKTQL